MDIYFLLIEQILQRESDFTGPTSKAKIRTILDGLLRKLCGSLVHKDLTAANIMKILDLSQKTDSEPCYSALFNKLTTGGLPIDRLKLLSPSLLSDIISFALRHGKNPLLDPFASFFKAVIIGWSTKMLTGGGGQPPKPSPKHTPAARADKMTCNCGPCSSIIAYFRSEKTDTLKLSNVDSTIERHLRGQLGKAGANLAAEWTKTAQFFEVRTERSFELFHC